MPCRSCLFCAHVTVLCPRKSICGRALTCRIGPFVCVRGQGGQSVRGLQMWHMLPTMACTNTAGHYRVPSCTQTGCRCKHKGREMTALPLWHTTASPHLLHKVWPEHSGEHCGKRLRLAHVYPRCTHKPISTGDVSGAWRTKWWSHHRDAYAVSCPDESLHKRSRGDVLQMV